MIQQTAPAAGKSRPINMEELTWHLEHIKTLGHHVRIRVAARSIGGQPLYAVEAATPGFASETEYTSRNRLSALRPTILINARHHANEVSSTTAVLRLLAKLQVQPDLLQRVNIVAVPLENVDGAKIHDAMQSENPTWKLHAARYNQDGYEYYPEYFKHDTLFTEAHALSRLWREWLPDVVLDAHGVPSHEWIQCFSGYGSPPRFDVSFWLPNALVYGILYEPRDQQANVILGLELAKAMSTAFQENAAIADANRSALQRYCTYGHSILPNRFPVDLINGSFFYRKDAAQRKISFPERHPHITAIHCVTEVADETAQGDYLEACAEAHLTAMKAAIEWLGDRSNTAEEACRRTPTGQIRRCRERQRPQNISGEGVI